MPKVIETIISMKVKPRARYLDECPITPLLTKLRNISCEHIFLGNLELGIGVLNGDSDDIQRGDRIAKLIGGWRDQDLTLIVGQGELHVIGGAEDSIGAGHGQDLGTSCGIVGGANDAVGS